MSSAWLALRPEAAPAAVPPVDRPLWSPDRFPALLAEAQGTVDLERAVDSLLGDLRSCVVVNEGSRPVLARGDHLQLTPASTQKILVGAALIHRLGGDFRFVTRVVAAERPRHGVVGAAWLVGAGDPFLATPEYVAYLAGRPRSEDRRVTPLEQLAAGLSDAGVRIVTGGIRGDDSRYDRTRTVPTWKPTYVTDNEVGPIGALIVNSGFPDFTPPVARAEDPAAHAAEELTRLAKDRGVDVRRPASSGTAPDHAVALAEIRSPPLREIVSAMVRESDNTAAELLVRELSRARGGNGTTADGTAAVAAELADMGLPVEGTRFGDGSGLDTSNATTCRLLASTVRLDDGPLEVSEWLAVAGRSGTLARRLVDTPLEGRVAAKTGSIKGVTGLTGFVDGRRRLSFAFLANGAFSAGHGRIMQDRLVALLSRYPGPQPVL